MVLCLFGELTQEVRVSFNSSSRSFSSNMLFHVAYLLYISLTVSVGAPRFNKKKFQMLGERGKRQR